MKLAIFNLIIGMGFFAQAGEIKDFQSYVWDKDIGHGRVERGIMNTYTFGDGDYARIEIQCEKDEILVNGGCNAAFGFHLTTSMPFTSSFDNPPQNSWICLGQQNLSTAVVEPVGKGPIPPTVLLGSLGVIITCEKLK